MKIFVKILLCILPFLIFINLYRYFTMANEYEYFGISGFFEYLSTADMWGTTETTITTLSGKAEEFKQAVDSFDVLNAIGNFFTMVGLAFGIPITILVDIINNVIWFIGMITGQQ